MTIQRPPRLPEVLLRIVLPRSEHATLIGELQEEYRNQVLPGRGRFRSALWYWSECLSLLGSYARILLVREQSRELSVVMNARRSRKQSGRSDNGKERSTRLDSIIQDIKHGFRSLKNRPSFTIAAMLTLAIGIGVNAAIFSILYSVMIQPLPFREPDRLISVYRTSPEWGRNSQAGVSYPDFVGWRDRNQVFDEMTAYRTLTVNLTGVGDPERLPAAEISHDLFTVLGITPEAGRMFRPDEDAPGATGTVILSHGLWQRRFGGDRNIIGSTIHLDKESHIVVGIAPLAFRFPGVVDLWRPLRLSPTEGHDVMAYWTVGRLREGISIDQARSHLQEIDSALQQEYPGDEGPYGVGMVPLRTRLVGELSGAVIVFYAVVSLVLLLVCANIANLMLALSTTRQTEIAIRSSLGAGRSRIARQLLTESILLSLCGGSFGIALGLIGRDLLLRYIPIEIPPMLRFHTDLPLVMLLIGIIVMTGILFGLAPAVTATRQDLAGLLQRGSAHATGTAARTRLRATLIILEVAVATFMLIGSGTFIKTYRTISARDNGIVRENVLTLQVSLPVIDYPDETAQGAFFRDFADHVRAIPGVASASVVAPFPFGSSRWQRGYSIDGKDQIEGRPQFTYFWAVEKDYFTTMGIPVIRGRTFNNEDDVQGAAPVLVITEAFARHHWPGEDPLGKQLKWGRPSSDRPWMEVVGVVGDIEGLDPTGSVSGGCYTTLSDFTEATMSLAIKTLDDPIRFVAPVRTALGLVDSDLPAYEIQTLEEVFSSTYWPIEASSWFFAVLTGIALLLAGVGIYGVVSYSVTRRTREFGIRVALGARNRDVISLVLRQITRKAGLGLIIGTVIAFILLQLASSLMFGVSPNDPSIYLLTLILMGGSALFAAWIPARRATRVDPIDALRQE